MTHILNLTRISMRASRYFDENKKYYIFFLHEEPVKS